MTQITLTLDLTQENLELLKSLCPAEKKSAKKKENLIAVGPEPYGEFTTQDVKPEPVKEEAPAKNEPAKVTLTDVRAVALKLSKAGKQDFLKSAFEKFGGKKLSDIKEADYATLLEELNGGTE